MSNQDRLSQLINSLGMEVITAQAGSDAGQFPILDLLGNLRDEAGKTPALAELHQQAAEAWERMVRIVESGQKFKSEEIQWLNELFAKFQSLAGSGKSAEATPRPPAPPSVAVAQDAPAPVKGAAATEDEPINLNIAADGDIMREFITESREHLDNIEHGVLVLENQPADAETLNTVFRAFHTFKGGAGFLNLIPINRLAHVLESLLDLARQGKLVIDEGVIDLILRGRDVLKQFLDEIEGQINGSKPLVAIFIPTGALKTEVQAMIDCVNSAGIPVAAQKVVEQSPEPSTIV